jgi:hypothetical protein
MDDMKAMEDQETRRTPMRIKRALTALFAIALAMALGSSAATADTTHVFTKYITVANGGNVEPEGVDSQGNLIVWLNDEHAVAKFDANGNPVNFSGLGTNMIDGAGGHNCPSVPADCDRVPTTNGFTTTTNASGSDALNVAAVDNSGGPADGYIYVVNNYVDVHGENEGEVDVFNPAGIYVGKLDETQVTPDTGGLQGYPLSSVSVASDGVVYLVVPGAHLTLTHVDRYVPVDGVAAHDQFAGQIRAACANAVCVASLAGFSGGAGSRDYFYAWGYDQTHTNEEYGNAGSAYMRFPMSEFHRSGLLNFAVSEDFSPDPGPFGNGGYFPPFNMNLTVIGVDPADQHVYIGQGWGGFQEWDQNNHQVGPMFASENCPGNGPFPPLDPNCHIGAYGEMSTIAFDRSGGPNDGNIYVRGPASNKIAVYSPAVTIPDINHPTVVAEHYTAQLSANIGRAGGPEVTNCHIEYGFNAPGFNGGYTSTAPCSVATPYAGDTTDVTADFTGLFPETDYHYRVVASNANGQNRTNDKVFHTLAVLGVRTDPATNLTRTSADLNGSLNPDGIATTYHFEFGITTQYNNRTPERNATPGGAEESVAPESISGLQPGRTYHYRLVAKSSLGKTKSADGTFLVPANPPIAGVRATNVAESSADLNARINPLGYDTTYHFEYGTSTNYGTATQDVDLGDQLDAQLVTAPISGLQSGVVYHFRVIAKNQWGTTTTPDSTFNFFPSDCPNSHIRQQTNANYLPDCRAYELVSPGSAGNVTLFPGEITKGASGGFSFGPELAMTAPNAGGAASAPARFGFIGGEGAIPGLNPPNGLMDRYVATRTTEGWVTTYPGREADQALVAGRPVCDLAMNVCLDYRIPPLFGGSTVGSKAPYVWDIGGKSLGRWPTNLNLVPNGDQGIADDKPSADFSHFVFMSVDTAFAPGGLDTPPGSVYDNDIAQKSVVIASYRQNGEQIPQEVAPGSDPNRRTEIAAVSDNGSHILMAATTNPACDPNSYPFSCPPKLSYPAHLYMRVNDAVTYEVSPGADAKYVGMTSDGSKVFFTSEEHLTAADTDGSVDLYQWSEATGSITLLSQGNGNGNADDCTALWDIACDVQPVTTQRPDTDDVLASHSGDIYFYSPEQLDPANPGVRNERNLYVYRNGAPHYVTTLDPGTQVDRMQISPDGGHMAFLSRTQATAYVNTAPNDHGIPTQWEEMYVFNPTTEEVLCASCIPSGEPPTVLTTDTGFAAFEHNLDVKASQSGRFMADDGRVAFATGDALVPADTNQKIDVYEFVDNGAQLISTGTGDRDTQGGAVFYPTLHTGLESFSRDGNDLYFSTFETLVPQDHNGPFVKYYDARSTGGFPIPASLLPCTAADECHGDASVPTPDPGIGTVGDLGSKGNHAQIRKQRQRHRRAHRHRRHRHHQTGSRSHG